MKTVTCSFFLIEINNIHRTRHILQVPVFGASADGAAGTVFRDIAIILGD